MDGPAKSAVFGVIGGLAVDTSGNLYIALHTSHMVVKVDASGNMTRVAGSGIYGFSGDGGAATSARLAYPQGLVFDKSGNLYIQDGGNQRVRMVSGGTITTVPGTEGLLGVTQGIYFGETSGLNSLPSLSSLALVSGMAIDSKGTLYVSDTINNRLFKVTGGVASILAGTGVAGYSGDGAVASAAQLSHPFGLAVDSSDNLFIADTHNNRIREILTSTGFIYTAVGLGQPYYSGDEGNAAAAAVNKPIGLAFDSAGNLYIADSGNYVIRVVWKAAHHTLVGGVDTSLQPLSIETAAGVGTTATPSPRPNPVPDGTAATAALLGVPAALATDAAGNVYFSDLDHQRVMMLSTGGVVSTVAGGGTSIGDNGPAASAQLVLPFGVAADSKGNVYSLDKGRNGVRKISGGTISTVAGNGVFGGAGDFGLATSAQLAAVGIASDAAGNLFFATSGNYLVPATSGRIRELTGGNMLPVAGTGQAGSNGDGGPATNAQLQVPMGVAVDGSGNFYIADTYNFRVRKVSASDKTISTLAGNGNEGYSGDGSAAISAQLGRPFRIAADATGNVYIADFDNSVIRKVTAATGIISTIAGTGTPGYLDGPAASAQIDRPSALAVNAAGDVFFFDLGKSVVRKISGGVITTVAGNGIRGYGGDNGPALSASLGQSYGLAVDATDNIYLSDVDNNLLRVLSTGTAACTYMVGPLTPQHVGAAGGSVPLTITTGSTCAWSVSGLPAWITVSGGSTGTGTANISLVVAANPGAARDASLTVAGTTMAILQAAGVCSYTLNPTGQFFAASGGSGTFQVTTNAGCAWSVTSSQSWVTLTGTTTGNASAQVSYQVAANAGPERQATLSGAGATYTIDQSADSVSGLASAGAMAHFAAGGGWTTTFTLVNTGASDATAQLNFTKDDGSAVLLPLSLPQTGQTGMTGSTLQRTLAAGTVLPIVSAASAGTDVQGSAQLLSTGNVGAYSVFQYLSPLGSKQEAVVPVESRNASSYWLAFDNTNGYTTGIAVSNPSSQTANIQVTVRNGAGAVLEVRPLTLPPQGHTAFGLTSAPLGYPETANLVGTLQFTSALAGQINVLGIRVNPQGSFTSVPALVSRSAANGSGLTSVGSFPHFASGGGWRTTFTLVNTGTSAATARLNFLDNNGAAVLLPVSLPQTSTSGQSYSTFEQTLAAGSTLIVETEGPASLADVSGSAQLQSEGNVTGSAVFLLVTGHQEAVVPLESRNGKSYVLAYDNTNGYFNGIAVANSSDQAASVVVTVRDAVTGAVKGSTHTITLPAKGHQSFLLNDSTLGFPETANTSGTLEFSTSTAGQISVLGLRFNSNNAFTSVPALLKQ